MSYSGYSSSILSRSKKAVIKAPEKKLHKAKSSMFSGIKEEPVDDDEVVALSVSGPRYSATGTLAKWLENLKLTKKQEALEVDWRPVLEKELITKIQVGPQRQSFLVYRRLLLEKSEYFRGSLLGNFKEGGAGVVVLEDEDPIIFGYVAQWLLDGRLEETHERTGIRGYEDIRGVFEANRQAYIKLWLLADYLQIPDLQDAAMRRLVRYPYYIRRQPITEGLIRDIYSRTVPEAELRKWIVQHHKHLRVDLKRLEKTKNKKVKEFLQEVRDANTHEKEKYHKQNHTNGVSQYYKNPNGLLPDYESDEEV